MCTLTDPARLAALMREFEAHGGFGEGGLHRLALSSEDGAARDALEAWWRRHGLAVETDGIGNMCGRLGWAGPGAPVVMSGSHLDSQPRGGRLDGSYGVLAACEALLAVREAMAGSTPACDLAVVNWTSEEGARFQPSLLGSSVFAGKLPLADALDRRDGDGVRVADALAAIGRNGAGQMPRPDAYIELHVECGPVLEAAGARLAAVTRHWGAVKQRVAFLGRQSHTGPTPMDERRDALLAAAHLVLAVRRIASVPEGTLHTSVGRLEVTPNSPNVVPGEAVLFIELRSAQPELLASAEAALDRAVAAAAETAGVRHELRARDHRPVGLFDAGLAKLAGQEADALGVEMLRLDTVAAHDAISLIGLCPALVLNVPSRGGICHDPAEWTDPADLALGAEVLARMMLRLARDGLDCLAA